VSLAGRWRITEMEL